jgi:aspartyl-tRNA(Asn)/glutamyl-tRNA(Gln) amidotransferase subunit B
MTKFTSDIVIGLEIHAELATDSKLFCSCPTHGNDIPNSRTCPVCLGHPGSKPVVNKKAIEYALKLCLALNCKINKELIFSRKSYFYPDLSKNYQISQFDIPLGEKGMLRLKSGKEVGITRVHIEEDPASLVHPSGMHASEYVLIDYNRSGDPLCEIVTEPDLDSPEQARDFMKQLITVLNYLGIFDVDRCIIKADANVSIKESGYIRSEIKNITGFKDIERALFYEVDRQKHAFKSGEKFIQDTRSWDTKSGTTSRIRTKETEADYGFILDPDLVKIEITKDMIDEIKETMPELAHEKNAKFKEKYKLTPEFAEIIAHDKSLAELFEKVAAKVDPMLAAKWLRHDLLAALNLVKKTVKEAKIDEKQAIDIITLAEEGKITETTAKELFEKLAVKNFNVKEHVEKEGLSAVRDVSELRKLCKQAIEESPKAVEDYKSGKSWALNYVVGKVMQKTKGKASPKEVNEILKEIIGE